MKKTTSDVSALLTDRTTGRHDRGNIKAVASFGSPKTEEPLDLPFTRAQIKSLEQFLKTFSGELKIELKAELKTELTAEILKELKPAKLRNLTWEEIDQVMNTYSSKPFKPYPGIKYDVDIDRWTPKQLIREWATEKLSSFNDRDEAIREVERLASKSYYCPATWTAFLLAIDVSAGLTEPQAVSVIQE